MALLRFLRLYLDPLALFENINVGSAHERAAARRSNVRRRRILLSYAKRWAAIASVCLMSANPLASAASAQPVLVVPFVGVELAFSLAFFALLVSVAVYAVLGAESR